MTDHKPQSDEAIALANEGKELEERVLRWLDKVRDQSVKHEQVPHTALTKTTFVYDQRFLALGKTNIQQGFMWAIRAIFQPGRIALPEDEQA